MQKQLLIAVETNACFRKKRSSVICSLTLIKLPFTITEAAIA